MHKIKSLLYITALGLHELNQVAFFTVELGKVTDEMGSVSVWVDVKHLFLI